MNRKLLIIWVCLLIGAILVACGPSQAEREAQAGQIVVNLAPTQTVAAPTSTPPPTPSPTPTPSSLTAVDIFTRLSPSVVFIETPTGTGSGVLIEDGYIVTNAHVVWPFEEARVVFPDGTEYLRAPVLNWDLLGDLAIIGPLRGPVNSLAFSDGEALAIGSEVFLIGYPGEVEQFPQPTITRGLISRLREWEPLAMTYFQTDATIAGGQSGGVLVSAKGEVIGISGFTFTEARFGLVASSVDLLPRVQRLIAGEDIAGLGDRRLPLAGGQREHDFVLNNSWDTRVFVIDVPMGTEIDIDAESKNDGAFGLIDVGSNPLLRVDRRANGRESGSTTTQWDAPYFLVLGQWSETPGNFHVKSNQTLIPYHDRDDGLTLTAGQTVAASLDYPRDLDYFVIELTAGEVIDLNADSVLIDPFIAIDDLKTSTEELVINDNNSTGLFGLNARLTYKAPHTGRYLIAVGDANWHNVGGYFLTITPTSPDVTPTLVTHFQPPMTLSDLIAFPFDPSYSEQSQE